MIDIQVQINAKKKEVKQVPDHQVTFKRDQEWK